MPANNAWKQVTCKTCRKTYQCTPSQDYYNATTSEDGVCEMCLLEQIGVKPENMFEVRLEKP
jgi:hypothetical protein